MIRSLEDVQLALRKVENELNALSTRDIQLNGRKVTGSGSPKEDSDLVNFGTVKAMLNQVTNSLDSINAKLVRIEARLTAGGI
jgi:hypothetical protein